MFKINISKEWSRSPKGRDDGIKFRNDLLIPMCLKAIEYETTLEINLDGCYGYPSAFIDEAFKNLRYELDDKRLLHRLKFISKDEPFLVGTIIDKIKMKEVI